MLTKPLIALELNPTVLEPVPGTADARLDPAPWLELVLAVEVAGVSLVTLADTHRGEDRVGRLDALMLAAWLAARARRIGVMASAATSVSEPFLLATQLATVDFVSHGRAGWLAQVSGGAADAGYVGPRPLVDAGEVWAEAAEYVAVVRALWDSWEDDAEIRDVAGQRFIDRERIHHINFRGEHLAVTGPSISPRPPQGQPPIALAVPGGPGNRANLALAVAEADVIFLGSGFEAAAVRAAAAAHGREARLLADLPVRAVTANVVAEAVAAGFDGVRLIPGFLPGELKWVTQLAADLGLDGHSGAGAPPTLRDMLGLPRPLNRHTAGAPTPMSGASA